MMRMLSSIGMIGGADGPTVIFVSYPKDWWMYVLAAAAIVVAAAGVIIYRKRKKK